MKLRDILREKGTEVYTIGPDATLADVVRELVSHNCGSLVVCNEGEVAGIITERDILRACADGLPLGDKKVVDVMTTRVFTGKSGDSVEDTMGLLTRHRIRHLPILDDGQLAGLISIGDVVKAEHEHLAVENEYLKSYIQS